MYRCYRRQKQLSNHKLHEAKEEIPMGGGLFLALLTVAPRRCLQMAREKAEYKQQSWVSQRNLHFLLRQINWEIQPVFVRHFTGKHWQNSSVLYQIFT